MSTATWTDGPVGTDPKGKSGPNRHLSALDWQVAFLSIALAIEIGAIGCGAAALRAERRQEFRTEMCGYVQCAPREPSKTFVP